MTPYDVVHRFWYDTANMCGCGDPVEVLEMVRDELARLDTPPGGSKRREPAPDTREHRLLAFLLDAWGLTEHGTSLAWPWLTDEGRVLLAVLRLVDSIGVALDEGGMPPFEADPESVERVDFPGGYAVVRIGDGKVREFSFEERQ